MKKAIITGASSGLGKEIGKELKNNKYQILNLSRNSSDFEDLKLNLNNNKSIKETIKEIKSNHNKFDLIIFNAGISPRKLIGEIDYDINENFRINVTGTIKLINELLDLIKKKQCRHSNYWINSIF